MVHKAWRSIVELPYCFPRSSTELQGHVGQKSQNFTRIERFQTNSSLNSPMDLKLCTKRDVA